MFEGRLRRRLVFFKFAQFFLAELEYAPRKAIMDQVKSEKAVMDVMEEKQAWRTDRPGTSVKK